MRFCTVCEGIYVLGHIKEKKLLALLNYSNNETSRYVRISQSCSHTGKVFSWVAKCLTVSGVSERGVHAAWAPGSSILHTGQQN